LYYDAGFKVHAFADPIMALQHVLKACKYCQILVFNIRMPALTGSQLVKKLKDLRPDMKVIMMTMFEVNKREFEAGFPSSSIDVVIRKPFIYTFAARREKNKRIFGHEGSRDCKKDGWPQGVIEDQMS
jgi:DNA-binding NtrC family response regulator